MNPESTTSPLKKNWCLRDLQAFLKTLHESPGEIIKYNPEGGIPCANGDGLTDLDFRLQNVRMNPAIATLIARKFEAAIVSLTHAGQKVDAIVEVPYVISPVAALLSVKLGIPMITIGNAPATNRAVDAPVFGHLKKGMNVVIVDDSIKDGNSKLTALELCRHRHANVVAVAVMVDLEGGARALFQKRGFGAPVWPGFTLSEARDAIKAPVAV